MRRALAVVLLLGALVGTVAPPAGADTRPTGSLRLVSQTSWLGATGSFQLRLAVDDLSGTEAVDVAVTLHSRTASRSAFEQSIETRPRGTVRTFPATALTALPTDGAGDRLVELPLSVAGVAATPFTLPTNLRQGVYPLTVALRVHGGATIDSFVTHLVRLPADPDLTPLSVAWIQTLGAPPARRPGGGSSLAPDEEQEVAGVVRALDASAALPVTLELTPETVAALDVDDLTRLRASLVGDQVLAAPYVDVDPSALLAAGFGDDIALQRQLGEDTLSEAVGDRGDPRTWSAGRALTDAAVAKLRTLGVTRLTLAESSLAPLEPDVTGGRTLTRPFRLAAGSDEVVQAAAVDPGLLAHFRNRTDQVLAAHQLLADLAVLFFDLPGSARGIVVRPPDSWHPSQAFLDVALPSLGDNTILRAVTLDQFFEGVAPLELDDAPVVRTITAGTPGGALPRARLDEAHQALDQLVSIAGPTSTVAEQQRIQLLVGESSRLSASERNALLAGVGRTRDDVRDRLELPDQRSYRLTARKGTLPLTVVNRNPFPVHVELQLSSDKLEFTQVHEADRTRQVLGLELEPGTRTITIPVQARASGTFNLRAALLTAQGDELRRSRLTIRSTVFSGVGIVLSIGAGLFLLLWWAKHWRTSRRAAHLVEAPS
jgi:hypothetical protein